MYAWTLSLLLLVPGVEPMSAGAPDFAELIKSFREGPAEALEAATKMLEGTTASIPALERELKSTDRFYRQRVQLSISKIEAKRYEPNKKRSEIWRKDERYDFLIDHIAIASDHKPYDEAQWLLDIQRKLAAEFDRIFSEG